MKHLCIAFVSQVFDDHHRVHLAAHLLHNSTHTQELSYNQIINILYVYFVIRMSFLLQYGSVATVKYRIVFHCFCITTIHIVDYHFANEPAVKPTTTYRQLQIFLTLILYIIVKDETIQSDKSSFLYSIFCLAMQLYN